MTTHTMKTRAPFLINNTWKWVTWTHKEGNLHAAVIAKGKELGALAWDTSQADHGFEDRVSF